MPFPLVVGEVPQAQVIAHDELLNIDRQGFKLDLLAKVSIGGIVALGGVREVLSEPLGMTRMFACAKANELATSQVAVVASEADCVAIE